MEPSLLIQGGVETPELLRTKDDSSHAGSPKIWPPARAVGDAATAAGAPSDPSEARGNGLPPDAKDEKDAEPSLLSQGGVETPEFPRDINSPSPRPPASAAAVKATGASLTLAPVLPSAEAKSKSVAVPVDHGGVPLPRIAPRSYAAPSSAAWAVPVTPEDGGTTLGSPTSSDPAV